MQSYFSAGSWLRLFAKATLLSVAVCAGLVLLAKYEWTSPLSLEQTAFAGGGGKRPPAPELTGGVAWLNTSKPLPLESLKGRIVLLDFWTLCCINCMHILPDLAKLEAKYPGILVVIGIHTPKFPNEEKTESISNAILRYHIRHPVINDADHKIWRRYGVNS